MSITTWFICRVKLSKSGPGGANFCIHKYFYSQSAFWKSVREENEEQDDRTQRREKSPEHEGSVSSCFKPQLDPIDSRHLASIEFVRSRVVKLLKNSKNGLHSYSNLIVSIVSSNCSTRKYMQLRQLQRGFRNPPGETGDFLPVGFES